MQAFKQNSNLINASYKAFDTLADTIGNPKVIPTGMLKKWLEIIVMNLL